MRQRYEKLMARWHAFLDAFRQLAPHVDEVEATRLEPDEVTHRLVEKPYRVPFITSMEIWKQFRTEWKISPSLDYEWFARAACRSSWFRIQRRYFKRFS